MGDKYGIICFKLCNSTTSRREFTPQSVLIERQPPKPGDEIKNEYSVEQANFTALVAVLSEDNSNLQRLCNTAKDYKEEQENNDVAMQVKIDKIMKLHGEIDKSISEYKKAIINSEFVLYQQRIIDLQSAFNKLRLEYFDAAKEALVNIFQEKVYLYVE